MTDLTPLFNEFLKSHDAPPTTDPSLALKNIDGFLKDAYRLNAHIASLNRYLKGIRQSYLSTAPPPRRTISKDRSKHLTDRQKEQVDAETKKILRDLDVEIKALAATEDVRQTTQITIIDKKYGRYGLGALGKWAAGGVAQSKPYEQEQAEAAANTISGHRANVLQYLRQKLQECVSLQASMMEKRIRREVEKNKSLLANSQFGGMSDFGAFEDAPGPSSRYTGGPGAQVPAREAQAEPEQELSAEQIQMFEKENQDMLKHYESTLDQVKTAEKSLVEISELQTQLVNNLALQSEHIDQLVSDSFYTAENVGGGNKQLKKATERKSTAKYVFYASCSLSLFLVAWDLVF